MKTNTNLLGPLVSSMDIALILESSYPYILGGVSTWVHQIIQNFPQYTFGLIFLGGSPENYRQGIRYELPPNVVHLECHFLFDTDTDPRPPVHLPNREEGFAYFAELHKDFQGLDNQSCPKIKDFSLWMQGEKGIDYEQFLYSKCSWDYLCEEYTAHCSDSSFIDYFWTIKNIHKPLWKLTPVLNTFPKARLVHTISTGYAGLLSFLINKRFGYPVMLTEHGIYNKERKIDIFLSNIFHEDEDRTLTEENYLRILWNRYFKTLGFLSYGVADPVVSLFQYAHDIQVEEGADVNKTLVIPNGVDIDRFKKLRRPFAKKEQVVCLIGRLVPMKDVKGYIRAVPRLHKRFPDLRFWIVGSSDEDKQYAEECHELVKNIMMQDVIVFKPHQSMDELLPAIQVVVLSSIREGMPLVILESFAAGIPVVATDVGACKELLLGLGEEDRAIGPAGRLVKVADAPGLEEGIADILRDQKLWEAMSRAAIARVERFYDAKDMIAKYKALYERVMD